MKNLSDFRSIIDNISSEEELRAVFEPRFHILELYISEISGKYGPHKVVVAMMKRE